MPKGGLRPGAGRPVGSIGSAKKIVEQGLQEPANQNLTPLEYMLKVVNDPEADINRRDRMAQAAAPYVHPRADTIAAGKKETAEKEAQTVDRGTAWAPLLNRVPTTYSDGADVPN